MTFQKISKTSSAKSETSTISELASKAFAPIAKQTTSAPILPELQEQTQGLLQRKTNLLAIPGLMAQPKTKRLQPIQAKLTIGEPGDKYEQEADAVASQVMSISTLQPEMVTSETQKQVRSQPLAAGITPLVQHKAMPQSDHRTQETGDLESRLNKAKGGGSPLPEKVKTFMEPRFNANLSDVRVHTGSEAVQMNREIGAEAFTSGNDIFYGKGNSPDNDHLTAHELAHKFQQTGGVQRMPAQQGNIVQCMREGKQRAEQPSNEQENEEFYDAEEPLEEEFYDAEESLNRDAINEYLDDYYTSILEQDIPQASPEELEEIASQNSLLSPVAEQTLMSSQGQEQVGGSSTNNLDQGQSSTPKENLITKEPQASFSSQSRRGEKSQPSKQEGEVDKKIAEGIEKGIVKSDTALSQLKKVAESIPSKVPQQQQSQPPQSEQNLPDDREYDDIINFLNTFDPQSEQNLPDRETQLDEITQQPPHSQQEQLEQNLPNDIETQLDEITQQPPHSQQQSQQNLPDDIETQLDEITQQPPHSQQQQSPATRFQKIKKSIAKPFDATKNVRKVLAEGIKQHETYSDQTKILGQDSPKSDVDQVLGQNLPVNEKNPITVLKPLPADMPQYFGNDAAVIGMTRDIAKATGGLLRVSDNLKKCKDAVFVEKNKPIQKRIGDASGGLGEVVSTVTYTGIVLSQAVRGIEHHTKKLPGQKTTFASGFVAAVKLGGKLGGTIPSIGQGGLIGGTSIPFDVGKATASTLTSVPKLINTVDAGYKAYPKENFGGYEYWISGLKNVTDLTKSVAGAVKDVAGLVNNLNVVGPGAEGTQIIAGGAVAPAAGAVLGGIEVIEGADKFWKAYNQYRNPGDRPEDVPLNKFKKQQKDKMIRAGIDATLGAVALGGGVVGFNKGPRGLLSATIMGASVGAFQIGEWGIRKLKQKMLHDSRSRTFDVEPGYEPGATANILHQP